jgi:8-hydroxy-5-deazaflavin:NADPH oxidoreductase
VSHTKVGQARAEETQIAGPEAHYQARTAVDVAANHGAGMAGDTAGLVQNMTTVGLVGSGNIGSTVARLAVNAGHDVVLSNSRGPDTLQELAAELGPRARAATGQNAVTAGDIVLVSVPLKAYPSLSGLPLADKAVMDTGNYYPQRDGQIPELDAKSLTDSEYLLGHLPGSQVVKVFNNIFFKHLLNLARSSGAADRSALPIAGDSPEAKAAVAVFLDSIGYGTVDAGSLADSWHQQPGTPVYGTPYGSFDNDDGTPAGAEVIGAALAAATR